MEVHDTPRPQSKRFDDLTGEQVAAACFAARMFREQLERGCAMAVRAGSKLDVGLSTLNSTGSIRVPTRRPINRRTAAAAGRGPDYLKIGTLVRYRQSDLDAYLERCTVRTSPEDA